VKLGGTLGSLAKLRDARYDSGQTFPINFRLSSDPAEGKPVRQEDNILIVDGSIGSSSSGASLVELTLDIDLSELMEVVSQTETPNTLGHLQGTLSLTDEDGSWRFNKIKLLSGNTNLYQLKVEGVVDRLTKNPEVELQGELTVPSPEALGEQLGIDLSGYAPYAGKGLFTGNKNQLNYQGHTTLGRIESEVILAASWKNNKPFIQGELNIPVLYLDDIGINQAVVENSTPSTDELVDNSNPVLQDEKKKRWWQWRRKKQESSPANEAYIFSREPLEFATLQGVDLDLSLRINEIKGGGYAIEELHGELKLTDGLLRISPAQLTFEEGVTNFEFEMDTRKVPEFTLKIESDDLVLGQLIAQMEKDVPIKGKANLYVDLKSRGRSAHELASALSGSFRFSLDDASLPSVYVEFLSADVFGWVMRRGTFGGAYTPLGCILVDLDINQGIAKSKLLIADGPSIFVNGATTIDLGEETLDMVLMPRQKKKLYSKMPPIKIYGSLRSPVVKALPKTAAVATAAGTVLLPAIFIPTYIVNKFWQREANSSSGCADFVEEYSAK